MSIHNAANLALSSCSTRETSLPLKQEVTHDCPSSKAHSHRRGASVPIERMTTNGDNCFDVISNGWLVAEITLVLFRLVVAQKD